MEKTIKKLFQSFSLFGIKRKMFLKGFWFSIIILCSSASFAQDVRTVKGLVDDNNGDPVVGATIIIKGSTTGTITNADGEFSLNVPASGNQTLVVSFIGMLSEEVDIIGKEYVKVLLAEDIQQVEEVIIVGYGSQKKESVVGAISQATGEDLARAGGISNIGTALTGNIPGLITLQGNGAPGDESPVLYIRGQGTWNYSNPLVLVDGIERTMTDIDLNSVQSISVLKDASATAVFGVKGANGVILITTKRGSVGKASIRVSANATMKIPSKIPGKYDSYDALKIRNMSIEREMGIEPSVWQEYTPLEELDKYRNPENQAEAERYPNVDWQEESFKNYAMSYNTNISISGGTPFVKYFTSMDYLHEGDIMKVRDNGKGYTPGYGYDRLNFRSNLDFNLTKSTTLSTDISGSHGNKKNTWSGFEYTMWQAAYSNPPDVFPVQYSDGTWGYYPADIVGVMNSISNVSNQGVRNQKTTDINTDFTLTQDLGMLLKGLNAKGTFSMDNSFLSEGGIYDDGGAITKWISPEGDTTYGQIYGTNNYDYILPQWSVRSDAMQNYATTRKLFYQIQLNYETKIDRHNITAMGLFSRDKSAKGSVFPHYREDWVFRATYNFAERYFIELNGAYNGSEKFSRDYRFQFFPSAAIGWMLSNENFMKNITWLNKLKIRGSYGLVGNDELVSIYDPDYEKLRWLYQTQWLYGGNSLLGSTSGSVSPYTWYKEGNIGNPEIHWETVTKKNIGIEYSLLHGLIEGSVDIFSDYRKDILIKGKDRAVVDYLGGVPPSANLGEAKVKGYEIEIKLNHNFSNGWRLWANGSMTHAKDEVIYADDPQLLPAYQKKEGFQIGQYKSQLLSDHMNTWDEVYGSTEWNTNDNLKLPGEFNIVDFNGDGVIDDYDAVPNGYPERPQNTYNASLGFDYKGFSFFMQFYGVNNVTRYIALSNFPKQQNSVSEQGDYWSKDNTDATSFVPRYQAQFNRYGNFYAYDGSYVRLKNAELSYTFESGLIKRIGMKSLRVYLNGNNLLLWTKMPDDRESNLGGWGGQGAYPTVRRINLGLNIVL